MIQRFREDFPAHQLVAGILLHVFIIGKHSTDRLFILIAGEFLFTVHNLLNPPQDACSLMVLGIPAKSDQI